MSSLTHLEKRAFENLFGLASGYVMGNAFSDRTFAEFFRDIGVNIDDAKYHINGSSKGKRFRAFWELESDAIVGKALGQLLELWLYSNNDPKAAEDKTYQACRKAAERLLGKPVKTGLSENEFLEKDFSNISIKKLTIESALHPILERRLKEVAVCLQTGAHLAAVIMSGSILEGILLGVAIREPQKFNQTTASPKDREGKVFPFEKWTLGNFIDVTCELGLIKLDVKKFGHSLRDFRNYIHPYEQMASGFTPDQHTAKISLQVLKAAIADLSGER